MTRSRSNLHIEQSYFNCKIFVGAIPPWLPQPGLGGRHSGTTPRFLPQSI